MDRKILTYINQRKELLGMDGRTDHNNIIAFNYTSVLLMRGKQMRKGIFAYLIICSLNDLMIWNIYGGECTAHSG